uniref:DUF4395 domain-containing protein n=1 Tax=uncultured Thiotrichaceae bacterium TaxID=298394 RepID=A0A6S6UGR3_9GAMM|nr:MAG: Unknown protein [uncultured Thiotrichaceae bacterium]
MIDSTISVFKNLWFRDPTEEKPYINDVAVRVRAGILLMIPLFMGLTLYDAIYTSNWVVTGDFIEDTLETNWEERIIYQVEAVKRTYDYSLQTLLLLYALFEMLAGMFVLTSRFSPTILISSLLVKGRPPEWKPLLPKRFAWSIGATLVTVCLVFFNPEILAGWVNALTGLELLPETYNYMPPWVPSTLVWICIGFMWLETVLGYCVGCKVHSLLVRMGVLEEECEACNNIDWDALAAKKQNTPS